MGTLEDVQYVPVIDGDEDDDDIETDANEKADDKADDDDDNGASGVRRRGRKPGGSGAGGGNAKQVLETSSNVTDLTLNESDDDVANSLYDIKSGEKNSKGDKDNVDAPNEAQSMAMRIAASLRPRDSYQDDGEIGASVCALCEEEISSPSLISACTHCFVQYHSACIANAMLGAAKAPPETLLPSRGLSPMTRWGCVACGMGITWEEAMEAGLASQRHGRRRKRR